MPQESQAFQWYFLLPSIIAGIFALIGSYFGAKLYRKSQHDKIILENRISVFKDFLHAIEICEKERAKDNNIPYYLICQPVDILISITKLHLNDKDRESFYKHAKDYINNFEHSIKFNRNPHPRANPSMLMERANHAKSEIEKIFNKCFSNKIIMIV